MKKLLPILLLCVLLLVGCAKKDDAPEASGSAETATEQKAEKKDKPASKSDKAKTTAAPAAESAAPSAQPKSAETAKPTAKPNPTVPDPTPTPKLEDWDDAEDAQHQILDVIKVNPVGNWVDNTTGTMMVIDGDFRGSILLTQKDGPSTVWTFTGSYDPMTGVLAYSDGVKQTVGSGGLKTEYQNSEGSLTVKDGKLVWTDAHETATITFVRDES